MENGGGGWSDRLVLTLVTASIAAALGWWLKGNEAHDGELAQRIDDAAAELEKIEDLAVGVWGKSPVEGGAAAGGSADVIVQLEGRLHRLAMLIDFAGARVPNFEEYGTALLLEQLRTACTDDGRDGSAPKLPPPPLRAKTILFNSTHLLLELRRMRRDVLPRGWLARLRRRFRLPRPAPGADTPRYWSDD